MKLLQNSKIYQGSKVIWYTHVINNLLPRKSTYYSINDMCVRVNTFEHKLIYWKVIPVQNHTGVHNETVQEYKM